MSKSKHDQIAERLANKFNTEYKSDIGIDLVTKNRVIEVETKLSGLDQGIGQIEHSSKARYLAVSNSIKRKTLEEVCSTGIGIMNERGKIIKRASRKKGLWVKMAKVSGRLTDAKQIDPLIFCENLTVRGKKLRPHRRRKQKERPSENSSRFDWFHPIPSC